MKKRLLITAAISAGLTGALLVPTVGIADAKKGAKPKTKPRFAIPTVTVGPGISGPCGTSGAGTGGTTGGDGGLGGGTGGGCPGEGGGSGGAGGTGGV